MLTDRWADLYILHCDRNEGALHNNWPKGMGRSLKPETALLIATLSPQLSVLLWVTSLLSSLS